MCIIAAKPAGVKMPAQETIRRMWYSNRDGAGFMYAADGKVRIEKGFMKLSDFEAALGRLAARYDLDALPIVLHFRITTHGGTKPSNCHPFPLTRSISKLQALSCCSAIGVAHNGIIPIHPRYGISDTMEYIATQLAPLAEALPEFYDNAAAMELIGNATQSKMAFLTDSGQLRTVGNFIEDGGVFYSNGSYYSSRNYAAPSVSKPKTKAAGKSKGSKPKAKRIQEKPLQWAVSLPNGSFAVDCEDGSLRDDLTDLLIDEDGKAYVFDALADAARKSSTLRLYGAEGFRAEFNADLAELERVIDDETDLPFRF